MADQVPVLAAAVGAEAGEQLHRFQQVRFTLPVAADHQQARLPQLQLQAGDVAEVQQFQALQPDGSGAIAR
jgi:hypothetical protein